MKEKNSDFVEFVELQEQCESWWLTGKKALAHPLALSLPLSLSLSHSLSLSLFLFLTLSLSPFNRKARRALIFVQVLLLQNNYKNIKLQTLPNLYQIIN